MESKIIISCKNIVEQILTLSLRNKVDKPTMSSSDLSNMADKSKKNQKAYADYIDLKNKIQSGAELSKRSFKGVDLIVLEILEKEIREAYEKNKGKEWYNVHHNPEYRKSTKISNVGVTGEYGWDIWFRKVYFSVYNKSGEIEKFEKNMTLLAVRIKNLKKNEIIKLTKDLQKNTNAKVKFNCEGCNDRFRKWEVINMFYNNNNEKVIFELCFLCYENIMDQLTFCEGCSKKSMQNICCDNKGDIIKGLDGNPVEMDSNFIACAKVYDMMTKEADDKES